MDKLSGKGAQAWWVDPRDGTWRKGESRATSGTHEFAPPSAGPKDDWVLVLDDADKGLPTGALR